MAQIGIPIIQRSEREAAKEKFLQHQKFKITYTGFFSVLFFKFKKAVYDSLDHYHKRPSCFWDIH